jgi:hypothetical protein
MQTPSSLALIALALLDGQLPFDERVERSLRDTVAARHAVRACTYGHDIAALIESFLDGPSRPASLQSRIVTAHG